ncbi:hypothetical protein ACU686_26780 [Yinghuangia aomiensis]
MTNTDAAFVALGVELNKVERRLTDEFGRVFGDIEDKIGELADRIGELEPPEGPAASAPWVWADMDGDQAAEAWEFLVTWLEEVLWPRHAESAVHLTACWFRHPDVVEELSVLCQTWLVAYRSKDATAVKAAEWLDRWLPGAMRRCSVWLAPCADTHQGYLAARPEPPPRPRGTAAVDRRRRGAPWRCGP